MATHSFPAVLIYEHGELKLANLVTLSRAVLIVPIIALLLAGLRIPALALYVLAALTDAVDGWIARRSGRASSFGAQLDVRSTTCFRWASSPSCCWPCRACGNGRVWRWSSCSAAPSPIWRFPGRCGGG